MNDDENEEGRRKKATIMEWTKVGVTGIETGGGGGGAIVEMSRGDHGIEGGG